MALCLALISSPPALLKAIANKLIPGISTSVRMLLVAQVEDTSDALEDIDKDASVLIHVIKGDKARTEAMKEFDGMHSPFTGWLSLY